MKTEYWISAEAKVVAEGPIMVGVAARCDNAAEIEECIEADPQIRGADPEEVQAKRPVWPLEMFGAEEGHGTNESGLVAKKGTVNLRWSCPEGTGLLWWAYNAGAGALTTGCVVVVFAKHYGVWLRD